LVLFPVVADTPATISSLLFATFYSSFRRTQRAVIEKQAKELGMALSSDLQKEKDAEKKAAAAAAAAVAAASKAAEPPAAPAAPASSKSADHH